MEEEEDILSPCFSCKKRSSIPGNCHIQCQNPPKAMVKFKHGGNKARREAQKVILKAKEEKEIPTLVIRCVWPRSGVFPLTFDGNTVLACSNYEEGKPEKGHTSEAMLATWLYTRATR